MSSEIPCSLKRGPSRHSRDSQIWIAALVLGAILLVVLTAAAGYSALSPDEDSSADELFFGGLCIFAGVTGPLLVRSAPIESVLEFLISMTRREYLSAHIGEKRPDGRVRLMSQVLSSIHWMVATLFSGVVIFVASISLFGRAGRVYLVFIRDRFLRSCGEIHYSFHPRRFS